MPETAIEESFENTFVARQPIFDRSEALYGYELLFRSCEEQSCAQITDPLRATVSVATAGFLAVNPESGNNQRVFINFTNASITYDLPSALPADLVVIELLESITHDPALIETVTTFRKRGFLIALDDFRGEKERMDLLENVDIVKIDIFGMDEDEIRRIYELVKPHDVVILAEKVETREMFRFCLELGFDLFQGFFFSTPEILSERKINSLEVTRLRLLGLLRDDDPDIDSTIKLVQADVSVSYRLLRYLNSASFDLYTTVNSIRHAANLLGWQKLRNWLRFVIISDMDGTRPSNELSRLTLQRARLFETVAEHLALPQDQKEQLFLLGLLSLLDAMLQIPMNDVTRYLPLGPELEQTLCQKHGPLSKWLELASAHEQAQWDKAEELSEKMELGRDAGKLFNEAQLWAEKFLHSIE